ncbi:SPASM domain-containing protein [Iamia majanohamensis]|uniref:SPASM domain-containing protein n=1 Tax=Iamia majanohamensis TaxID=467976 RepID=A0AAF0BUA8_9ACTN|nr:radical SAM protein [Iamia majanohamensis]WCO65888.1 SPASM domain-containing protein [Iamia majanohamensis]
MSAATASSGPTCRAPFVSMEFDPTGAVLACCANALYPLGHVGEASLRAIWEGPRAEALRAAVARGDLALGCTICRHRLRHDGAELPMRAYDHLGGGGSHDWPERLSFSLHNTCNLECVMCGADRSSRIRSRRAGMAPLPHAYGDAFFGELEEFLAHATTCDFVGGEPFLVREHWRVWDLLRVANPGARCAVVTNGTVWNDRVEGVLADFPTDVRLSMDGFTKATFESVRVGADFQVFMRNLVRFRDYAHEAGTELSISWSFVRHSWAELAETMAWAEDLGIPVYVQTVIERDHGVQHMADDELRRVLEVMEAQGRRTRPALHLNGEMWDRQVAMVASEVERRAAGRRPEPCLDPPGPANIEVVRDALAAVAAVAPGPEAPATPPAAAAHLRRWHLDPRDATHLRLHEGALRTIAVGGGVPGAPVPPTVDAWVDELCHRFEGELWLLEELWLDDGVVVLTLGIGGPHRDGAMTIIRVLAHPGRAGVELGAFLDEASRPQPVAVDLRARRSA